MSLQGATEAGRTVWTARCDLCWKTAPAGVTWPTEAAESPAPDSLPEGWTEAAFDLLCPRCSQREAA